MWILEYSIYRHIKKPNVEEDVLPTYEKDNVSNPLEKPQQDDNNCWLLMNDIVATNPPTFCPPLFAANV